LYTIVRRAHHVNLIPVTFAADILKHVRIRYVIHGQRDAQGLGQGLGIVESDLKLHVSEIAAPESLGYAQVFGMRVACPIEPTPVIEARGLDHERVSLPVADRVP